MYEDNRPYHDHGTFTVDAKVCSDNKHKAIAAGLNPHKEGYDKEGNLTDPLGAFFVMLEHLYDNVRFKLHGNDLYNLHCACCKHVYGCVDLKQPEPGTNEIKTIRCRVEFSPPNLQTGVLRDESDGHMMLSCSLGDIAHWVYLANQAGHHVTLVNAQEVMSRILFEGWAK